jgi:hypothetical protein
MLEEVLVELPPNCCPGAKGRGRHSIFRYRDRDHAPPAVSLADLIRLLRRGHRQKCADEDRIQTWLVILEFLAPINVRRQLMCTVACCSWWPCER